MRNCSRIVESNLVAVSGFPNSVRVDLRARDLCFGKAFVHFENIRLRDA